MNQFSELPLTPPILKALERMEYTKPTDVQTRTIPLVIEGRDVLVTAQTGTGKTAAFAVPILQRMIEQLDNDEPVRRALILAPTRELAEQIGLVLRELTFFFKRLRYAVVIGGAPYGKQFRELGMSPAFIVGTPGRLIDHIETKTLNLADFDYLVLDEADRMLDMGFAPQIEMIVKSFPLERQTMMFSATLPPEVRGIVSRYLKNPARVAIGEENRPVAKIQQDMIEVREGDKTDILMAEIDKVAGSIIVFTKTRVKADVVAEMLSEAGHQAAALHGELTQRLRKQVTTKFRDGTIRILVATDIAARGLDIDHVRHVINYDLPMVPEDYIHRIGRTGRAGKEGHSIAFVTQNERGRWNQILRIMGLPSQGGARASRSGYAHASKRSAFSGGPGNERTKPFAKPFEGSPPAKFQRSGKNGGRSEGFGEVRPARKAGGGQAPPRINERRADSAPVRGAFGKNAEHGKNSWGAKKPAAGGKKEFGKKEFGEKREYSAKNAFGARPLSGNRKSGGNGQREFGNKPAKPAEYDSPRANSIREEFESRSTWQDKARAEKFGRPARPVAGSRSGAAPARDGAKLPRRADAGVTSPRTNGIVQKTRGASAASGNREERRAQASSEARERSASSSTRKPSGSWGASKPVRTGGARTAGGGSSRAGGRTVATNRPRR